MNRIGELVKHHDLRLIEDCAHAVEAEYHGRATGTFGDFGCFSFYVTKNIVTGEGGMVIARKGSDIARVKTLALHGMTKDAWSRFGDEGYKHYYVIEAGFKYNMMDIQAAIGIHQLAKIGEFRLRRKAIWRKYQQAFASLPITIPAQVEAGVKHAYHLYNILVDEQRCGISRDAFLNAMTRQNIGVGVHYLSIPEHPYYQARYDWKVDQFPHAGRIGRQTLSLPLSPKLSDSDVEDVIKAVVRCLDV